ncbi:hypothetical protein ACFY30_31865 [Streptomyces sp. NPDC000345]|uniref:hypothetical protein n=1 Tax=Streptomyces sp. NPDC000345 TaxID=3364537 RepID=UPI003698C2DE
MDESAERRRAPRVSVLSIGVGSFTEGTEEELGFVAGRVEEVAKAFERLNAEVETQLDLDEDEIENLLRRRLVREPGPADVLVVHLVGHGRVDRGSRLAFVAHDDRDVDVDRWIEKAQQEVERDGGRRRVVFLVDTCSAGTATGRQPFTELEVERGVWALGACVGDTPTERGKFSGWVAAALHRLADRDFTLDEEAISFGRFVREVIRVNRKDTAGLRLSIGFHVEQGDADWPFLPNPRLVALSEEQLELRQRSLGHVPGEGGPDAAGAAGQQADDSRYFADRASGRGLVPADPGTGFFSGRAAELEQYTRWLAGRGRLLTVTGAAGAGKSGLLGVIVCAAEPGLRQRFRELWESAGPELPEVPGVVAVHARQRSAQQVVEAIVSAAGLEGEGGAGGPAAFAWNARSLRAALAQERQDRLVVLDAVDESTEPQEVLSLVAGLLAPRRGEGTAGATAPCRILLGGRREVVSALSALEEAAGIASEHIDLDTAERPTVEQDVHQYVQRMLRAREPYATGPPAEFVDLLAKEGARSIVREARPDGLWGPFLLAGLYVHYLLTLRHPPQDEVGADAYAKAASADLPSLLESILKTRRPDFPCLRAVLAVLARSRGDGMPSTVLRRCLRALDAEEIDERRLRDTLWEASPFLRYGTDPRSGETLYRLFHQGLADYLRTHPVSRDPWGEAESVALERRLLAEIVGPYAPGADEEAHGEAEQGGDAWEAAEDEPYVLRHALGHAAQADSVRYAETLLTDPYFLVRFDLGEDHRAMDLVRSGRAADCLRLLSASWRTHSQLRGASDRAAVFVFDADRLGLDELRERFTRVARQLAVRPESAAHVFRWARGGRVDSGSRFIPSPLGPVRHISFSPDGGLLAVGTWQGFALLETDTWKPVTVQWGRAVDHSVTTVAFSPDGRLLAVGRDSFRRSVQLWDVRHRVFAGPPWECRTGAPTALAFSPDSRLLAVGSRQHGVSLWDVCGGRPVEVTRREPGEGVDDVEEVQDVGFSPDGRLLVVAGTAGVTLCEPEHDQWTPLTGTPASAVGFSPDGRLLAVASADGTLLYSARTRDPVARVDTHDLNGTSVVFTPDASLLVVSAWDALLVVDTASDRVVNRLLGSGARFNSIAMHPVTGVLVSSDQDGHLRLWKDFTRETPTPQLTRFDRDHVVGSPTGRFIAVYESEKQLLTLRDPVTGRDLGSRALARAHELAVSPDGRALAVVGYKRVCVFRTGTPDRLPEPEVIPLGERRAAEHPLFSPDSRFLAVALEDENARALMVWEASTLRLHARIPLPAEPSTYGFTGPLHLYVVVNGALATYSLTPDPPEDTPV